MRRPVCCLLRYDHLCALDFNKNPNENMFADISGELASPQRYQTRVVTVVNGREHVFQRLFDLQLKSTSVTKHLPTVWLPVFLITSFFCRFQLVPCAIKKKAWKNKAKWKIPERAGRPFIWNTKHKMSKLLNMRKTTWGDCDDRSTHCKAETMSQNVMTLLFTSYSTSCLAVMIECLLTLKWGCMTITFWICLRWAHVKQSQKEVQAMALNVR